jgi:hypothetical protein
MPADSESVLMTSNRLAAPLMQLMCITLRIRGVETVAGGAKSSLGVKGRRSGRAAFFVRGRDGLGQGSGGVSERHSS